MSFSSPPNLILGLCGYAGVGKDTAARVLLDSFGFQRIAFAAPMRQALLALDPLVPVDPEESPGDAPVRVARLSQLATGHGWGRLKENPEVRRLLQAVGTEVGRNLFDTDFWVKLAERRLESTLSVGPVVFTDVRFPNEARLVKKYGGLLLRLERPGYGPVNDHLSDRASATWSYDERIVNDSTVESLHEKMRLFARHLGAVESSNEGENP